MQLDLSVSAKDCFYKLPSDQSSVRDNSVCLLQLTLSVCYDSDESKAWGLYSTSLDPKHWSQNIEYLDKNIEYFDKNIEYLEKNIEYWDKKQQHYI